MSATLRELKKVCVQHNLSPSDILKASKEIEDEPLAQPIPYRFFAGRDLFTDNYEKLKRAIFHLLHS